MPTTRRPRASGVDAVAGRNVNSPTSGVVVVTGRLATLPVMSAQSNTASMPPSKSPGARQSVLAGSALYAFSATMNVSFEVPMPGKSTTRFGKTIR